MKSSILALAAVGLASAATFPTWPAKSYGKGFMLVINVTDLSRDFADMPVHGLKLDGIHSGAGLLAPTVSEDGDAFFANGSSKGPHGGSGTVQLDISGPYPYGLQIASTPDSSSQFLYGMSIAAGLGSPNFEISYTPRPCSALFAPSLGTFAVCDTGFAAPEHPRLMLQYVENNSHEWYSTDNVPDNCVAVKLVPQCTALTGVQNATYPQNIWDSECYKDVAAIEWSQYDPCW
jgi:hypothetical protein